MYLYLSLFDRVILGFDCILLLLEGEWNGKANATINAK